MQLVNTKSIKYFSVPITYNRFSIRGKEFKLRIGCAIESFKHQCKLLGKQNLNLNTQGMNWNSLLRSGLSYTFDAWRQTRSEIYKLSAVFDGGLFRSMIKNSFERIKTIGLSEDYSSLYLVDWGNTITKNSTKYKITWWLSITKTTKMDLE